MTPLEYVLVLGGVAFLAGILGAILGIGGGLILTPVLTLWLGLDIRYAVGASIVSTIATSSGAAAAYVADGYTNLRVAMVLEVATSSGALLGALVAARVDPGWLYVLFGTVLGLSALAMLKGKTRVDDEVPPDPLCDRLGLHGSYFDPAEGREVPYRVTRLARGFALMLVAGVVSGLLGIGSGALKVSAMDLAMRLPIKVSTATSNFMIGVTAAASTGLYFGRGDVLPMVAGPVAIGVLLGSLVGTLILPRIEARTLRRLFVVVLLWVSFQMLRKGLG